MARLIVLLSLLLLTACPEAGLIGSPLGNYRGDDKITLDHPVSDFIFKASQLGRSLGYAVTGSSAVSSSVSLEKTGSMAGAFLVGAVDSHGVTLALQPDGRTIVIQVDLRGNFGVNSAGEAQTTITQFKQAIQQQL